MHRTTRLPVSEINQHFVCVICDGYIIDATTIVECLHSFCRTCIVRFLETSKFCPVCDVQVHKTKPLQSIRSDSTLQDVIYKLIPGLYQNEMLRRREFYAEHPEAAASCSSEERGEGAEQRCFYSPQESISLSLEYFKGSENSAESELTSDTPDKDVMTRYLKCPAAMTVAHLKKFIRMKFSLPFTYTIKIMYSDNLLSDDFTLIDIAYIYSWRRAGPMKFLYTFTHRKHVAQRPALPAIAEAATGVEPQTIETTKDDDTSVVVDVKTELKEKMDTDNATVANGIPLEPIKSEEPTISPVVSTPLVKTVETSLVEQSTSSTTTTDFVSKTEAVVGLETPNNIALGTQIVSNSSLQHPVVPQFVSQPQSGGNLKLKLIPLVDPNSKANKSPTGKKSGRKAGRSRYKAAPVTQRLQRLAPYPPPHQTAAVNPLAATVNPLAVRKYGVPAGVMNTMAPMMLSFVPTTATAVCGINNVVTSNSATAGLCSMNNMATTNSTGMCGINNNMVNSNSTGMCGIGSNMATGKPATASHYNINNVMNGNPVTGMANNMANSNPVTTGLVSVNNAFANSNPKTSLPNSSKETNSSPANSSCNISNVSSSSSVASTGISHTIVNSKPTTTDQYSKNNLISNNPALSTTTNSINVSVASTPMVTTGLSSINNTNVVNSKPATTGLYSVKNIVSTHAMTTGGVCSIKTVAPSMPIILPTVPPTMVNGQQDMPLKTPTVPSDKKPMPVSSSQVITTETLAPRPAFYPPPSQQQTATTMCAVPPTPLGHLASPGNSSSLKTSLVPASSVSVSIAKTTDLPTSSAAESKTESTSKGVSRPTTPSLLMAALRDDKIGKKNDTNEIKSEMNGKRATPSPSSLKRTAYSPSLATPPPKRNAPNPAATPPPTSKDFHFSSPEKKSAFEQSVKNSISAEFSDNDDLGCQPDLVVDEQKMEENDASSDEDEESALRKKITAIAEEKEDEDSGRASDISSQARSSCDDDVGSPSIPTATSSNQEATVSSCLPNFSLASSNASASSNRASKSNNINHVINNLLMRNHERKDSMGALDLSTCTTKPTGPSRPKPVANPVLDIKHRQQTYLPAPGNNTNNNNSSGNNSTAPAGNSNSSKQHTACVPTPKHPILMHGLASTLSPLQLSAMHGKSPHLPVPPFHGTAMVYPSQGNSRTSPATGRSPTYNQTALLSAAAAAGMMPRMSSYPSVIPNACQRTYGGLNHGNNSMKGLSQPNSPSTMSNNNNAKSPKYNNNNNHPKTPPSSASNPRTYNSHLKGLASQPQNPYSKGSSNNNNKSHSPVSGYKKNFPVYSPTKKQPQPPPTPSYKSYNTKFKSTGNLAVINPDPNGSLHKLVIRNLDARPTSPQSQKL